MKFCTYESEVNPITQTEKFSGVTDKYKLIRTDKVIEVFQDNGLQVVGESVSKARKEERQGFQRHLVAFSNDQLNIGEERLQLLLTNSHDGTSSYQLDLGAFRFACANGLVQGDVESTIKIRHVGNCLDRLDKAISYQLDRLPQIAAQINEFKGINVDPETIKSLFLEAAKIRCGSHISEISIPKPKRASDLSHDLWTVFNRIQEVCLRGGLHYYDPNAENKNKTSGRWKKTRKITGVSSVTKINKDLWNLADSFKKAA